MRRIRLTFALLFLPTLWLLAASAAGEEPVTVGIQGVVEAELPSKKIEAKQIFFNDKLYVELLGVEEVSSGTYRYRFNYMGMTPGDYDLRNYVNLPDGMTTASLPAMRVTVPTLLPGEFQGELTEAELSGPNLWGGYTKIMIAVLVLWAIMLPTILYLTRRPEEEVEEVIEEPKLTFADRLRPLVEKAAKNELTAEEKALLERLLIGFWRRKLELKGEMKDCIRQLKAHDEAGALVRALEEWLHRPAGQAEVDVAGLLEPYKTVAADFVIDDEEDEEDV